MDRRSIIHGGNNRSVSFVFAYTTAISRIDSIDDFLHFITNQK
jgi:hypothetical protein